MKIIESKEKLLTYLGDRNETAYEIDRRILLKDAAYNYPIVVEFVDETTDGFAYKVYPSKFNLKDVAQFLAEEKK